MKKKGLELSIVPKERIVSKIYWLRGQRVMFDRDLAELYNVKTQALNQAVRRNRIRFPEDFMFQLTKEEVKIWMSQIVISNREKMGLRKAPLVFTELGVAMLSSVLKSEKAIEVNILIMRAFIKMREMLLAHKELREKLEKMERKYDKRFRTVFTVLKGLLKEEAIMPVAKIGFSDKK
jgi:hypothetical protein